MSLKTHFYEKETKKPIKLIPTSSEKYCKTKRGLLAETPNILYGLATTDSANNFYSYVFYFYLIYLFIYLFIFFLGGGGLIMWLNYIFYRLPTKWFAVTYTVFPGLK